MLEKGSQIGAAARSVRPSRCQAPGAAPGRMLANRRLNRCQAPGAKQIHRSLGLRPEPADASKQAARSVRQPDRCDQVGATKSVPGTRCVARSDASKQAAQIGARHQVRSKSTVAWVCDPSLSMLANRQPDRCGSQIGAAKSVPGTRCVARSDASKQAAQIGARHQARRQVGC
jgi:hypothetical protein